MTIIFQLGYHNQLYLSLCTRLITKDRNVDASSDTALNQRYKTRDDSPIFHFYSYPDQQTIAQRSINCLAYNERMVFSSNEEQKYCLICLCLRELYPIKLGLIIKYMLKSKRRDELYSLINRYWGDTSIGKEKSLINDTNWRNSTTRICEKCFLLVTQSLFKKKSEFEAERINKLFAIKVEQKKVASKSIKQTNLRKNSLITQKSFLLNISRTSIRSEERGSKSKPKPSPLNSSTPSRIKNVFLPKFSEEISEKLLKSSSTKSTSNRTPRSLEHLKGSFRLRAPVGSLKEARATKNLRLQLIMRKITKK